MKPGYQAIEPSGHQAIRQTDHQTIKQADHQAIRQSSHQAISRACVSPERLHSRRHMLSADPSPSAAPSVGESATCHIRARGEGGGE
eukprot:7243114-Prymnesium_polylepis.1